MHVTLPVIRMTVPRKMSTHGLNMMLKDCKALITRFKRGQLVLVQLLKQMLNVFREITIGF